MRRGFTLIELLIVISICGLFFTLSFPTLANFKGRVGLDASTKVYASDLRKTQVMALCRNETQNHERFKFSKTGSPLPGGFGTKVLSNRGLERKVIVSSAGRMRIE